MYFGLLSQTLQMLQTDNNGGVFSQRYRGWISYIRVLERSGSDEHSLCGWLQLPLLTQESQRREENAKRGMEKEEGTAGEGEWRERKRETMNERVQSLCSLL